MKYDFTSIMDRKGRDAIAVDMIGQPGGFAPEAPAPGFDVIPMWVADMNFPTAPGIIKAIMDRTAHPAFGYFQPREEYYDSIIRWQRERHGIGTAVGDSSSAGSGQADSQSFSQSFSQSDSQFCSQSYSPESGEKSCVKDEIEVVPMPLTKDCIGYENGVLGGVVSALNVFCSRGDSVLVHSPTYIGFTNTLRNNGYHIVHSPLIYEPCPAEAEKEDPACCQAENSLKSGAESSLKNGAINSLKNGAINNPKNGAINNLKNGAENCTKENIYEKANGQSASKEQVGERYHWRMDYEDMENKIRRHHIHAAIFCSPHNPCGRVWNREELEKAFAIFEKYDVKVISDEIWSDIILNGHRHIPVQSVSQYARENTVALYAPSKTFNLAGLVGSYHIIYNRTLRERIRKEASLCHYNEMNVLSMYALLGAYTTEGMEWVDELRTVLTGNVHYATEYIRTHFKGVTLAEPEGTYMLFADCTQWCRDHGKTLQELEHLCWQAGVALQDGKMFHGPCHLRINLALPLSRIQEAMDRLDRYVFNAPQK